MPNINLIAARREEKKRLERLTRQLFFGLAGSVAVLTLTVLFLGARRFSMNSELREAEARMQTLQPKLDRIAEVEKESDLLKPKVDTLQTAKMNTLRWRAVFQVVSQAIPENTWLNSLTAAGVGDDNTTIRLTGTTASQSLVGDTMTRLNANPLFDKVDLTFTQSAPPTPDDPVQRVSFEIGAHLRSNAPAKDEKKDGAAGAAPAQKASAGTNGGNNNG